MGTGYNLRDAVYGAAVGDALGASHIYRGMCLLRHHPAQPNQWKHAGGSSGTQRSDTLNAQEHSSDAANTAGAAEIDENGSCTSKEDVALYLHTYGHLPSNFISKSKTKKAG